MKRAVRWIAVGLAIGALAAGAVPAIGAEFPATAKARSTSRLMVSGDEYSLVLSRQSLARGPALIQFVNRGEDAHDLRLRKVGGHRIVQFPELKPDRYTNLGTSLSPGRYRLWCSLAGHRGLGMRAGLTVRR